MPSHMDDNGDSRDDYRDDVIDDDATDVNFDADIDESDRPSMYRLRSNPSRTSMFDTVEMAQHEVRGP